MADKINGVSEPGCWRRRFVRMVFIALYTPQHSIFSSCFGLTTETDIRQTCGHVHLFRSIHSCPECVYSAIVTHVTGVWWFLTLTCLHWPTLYERAPPIRVVHTVTAQITAIYLLTVLYTLFSLLHIYVRQAWTKGIPYWFEKIWLSVTDNKSCQHAVQLC